MWTVLSKKLKFREKMTSNEILKSSVLVVQEMQGDVSGVSG